MGILASLEAPGPQALSSHKDARNSLPASHPEQLLAVTCVSYLVWVFFVCVGGGGLGFFVVVFLFGFGLVFFKVWGFFP